MGYRVVHVPGDGIGPEVTWAARRVLDATGVAIDWTEAQAGEDAFRTTGDELPRTTRTAVRNADAVLKGPMANHAGGGYASPNIGLRREAGVHVNVREARAVPGARTRFPETDLVVVRDVTEDVYHGPQTMAGPDAAVGLKLITREATHRAARFAFEYAVRHGRRKVTIAHKASTLKRTDGLFLEAAYEVAAHHPGIECDDVLIDALAMHLVREPERFDVLLATFQYGDILADLAAGLAGGLGLVPGATYGERSAFFEAAHGSAPKHAGHDRVNPTALVLSGALLLDHLGEHEAAGRVRAATARVIAEGRVTTYDLGGSAGTRAMTDAIVAAL